MPEDDYREATREGYQSPEVAEKYRRYHTEGLSWKRITMCRQRAIVARLLGSQRYKLAQADGIILDAPCGTGLLGPAFATLDAKVVAADISMSMLAHARADYVPETTAGFCCFDITQMPFAALQIDGVVVLGLFHRLPKNIRLAVLGEITRVTRRWLIASFTKDNWVQRSKRSALRALFPSYRAAPFPWRLDELIEEVSEHGFELRLSRETVPLLSSEVVCLFERKRDDRSRSRS